MAAESKDAQAPPTCGQGLAANSSLPAKMGDLTAALAETLELHMPALDLSDENSRTEYEAYRGLAISYRQTATALQTTASTMAGYRDLPMGRHDMKVMSSRKVLDSFEQFVKREDELLSLLQERIKADRTMLATMRDLIEGTNR
jgi:hypothetical protein